MREERPMTNYRRLISYIYAYEGEVKGKNIGFVKLEARNGQCRISVNVKKIYMGGNDIGVYLLTPGKELWLGNIFVRSGAGEFRTTVAVGNIADSGCSLEQCYGLCIHEKGETWRTYVTVWEDAVAQTAQIELAQSALEHREDREQQIDRKRQELNRELERAGMRMELQAAQVVGGIYPSDQPAPPLEMPQVQPEREPEPQVQPERETEPQIQPGREPEPQVQPEPQAQPKRETEPQAQPELQAQTKPQMQPGSEPKPQAQPEAENESEQPQHSQSQRTAQTVPASRTPMFQRQSRSETSQPMPIENLLPLENQEELNRLEREEQEQNQPWQLWDSFRSRYPKIQAFDSPEGCEVLTIRPRDIGLLPREAWGYGNNSFLLHGFYNYRYLILAKVGGEECGAVRYILGVPGHYYSNEKYMASMFGFPHFVLSKKQPSQDGRFGYWYTDVKMGTTD